MSTFIRKSVSQMAAITLVAGASFSAAAEQINMSQLVAYNMSQQMVELKYQLNAELQQSIYDLAFGQIKQDTVVEGRRPMVRIKDVKSTETEE